MNISKGIKNYVLNNYPWMEPDRERKFISIVDGLKTKENVTRP